MVENCVLPRSYTSSNGVTAAADSYTLSTLLLDSLWPHSTHHKSWTVIKTQMAKMKHLGPLLSLKDANL